MKIEDKAIQILNKKTEQLKPEYIKKDTTILGVTGTYDGLDTSDGTLQSQDMVEGSIGYSKSEKVVGSMPYLAVNNFNFNNITNMVNTNRIRIQQDMNTLIENQKAYVKRSDQLNIYINHNTLSEAINVSPEIVKLNEEILNITGTFISPIDETLDYDRLLEKTDTILGENSMYQYLDYIQSNGTQYIDTQYIPNNSTKIEIQFEYVNKVTNEPTVEDNYDTVIGCRQHSPDLEYLLTMYEGGYFGYGVDSKSGLSLDTQNKVYTVRLVDRKFYMKDNETNDFNLIEKLNQQEFTMAIPLYLFAENQENLAKWNSAIKLYYCKIYSKTNNVYNLERHFVPVINKATSEVCLFDRVQKEFYYNMGTGSFIAGPEKSSVDIAGDYSECLSLSNDILGN